MRFFKRRKLIPALFAAELALRSSLAAAAPGADDLAIAQSLAEMLRDARTVISNEQDLINDPQIGDKHLTGKTVLERAVKIYSVTTGVDPRKLDPASREGRLMQAMMKAIVAANGNGARQNNALAAKSMATVQLKAVSLSVTGCSAQTMRTSAAVARPPKRK